MAINDITVLAEAAFGEGGSSQWLVKANSSAQGTGATYVKAFRTGEPVYKTLGNGANANYAQVWGTFTTGTSAKPVVGTDFVAGIVISGQGGGTSTETDTADGFVYVMPLENNTIFLMNADNAATYGTGTTPSQSTYNALIGSRVLIKMDTSVPPKFTILASDSSTSGLIVAYLDVTKYPGKVACMFRNSLSFID
jgi:hypothetical protein